MPPPPPPVGGVGGYNHYDIGEEAEWRPPLLYANPLGHRVPAGSKRGMVFLVPPPLQGAKMFKGCRGQGLHVGTWARSLNAGDDPPAQVCGGGEVCW